MRDSRGTGKSRDGSLRGRRLPGSGQVAIAEVQELQGLPADCRGKGWDGIGGFFWMIALASGTSRVRGGVSGRGRSRSQARPRRHVRLIRSRRGSDPGHPSLPSPVENPNFAKRLRAGEGWSRSGPTPPVAPGPAGCHGRHRPDTLQQARCLVHRLQAAAPGVQELQGVPADPRSKSRWWTSFHCGPAWRGSRDIQRWSLPCACAACCAICLKRRWLASTGQRVRPLCQQLDPHPRAPITRDLEGLGAS